MAKIWYGPIEFRFTVKTIIDILRPVRKVARTLSFENGNRHRFFSKNGERETRWFFIFYPSVLYLEVGPAPAVCWALQRKKRKIKTNKRDLERKRKIEVIKVASSVLGLVPVSDNAAQTSTSNLKVVVVDENNDSELAHQYSNWTLENVKDLENGQNGLPFWSRRCISSCLIVRENFERFQQFLENNYNS